MFEMTARVMVFWPLPLGIHAMVCCLCMFMGSDSHLRRRRFKSQATSIRDFNLVLANAHSFLCWPCNIEGIVFFSQGRFVFRILWIINHRLISIVYPAINHRFFHRWTRQSCVPLDDKKIALLIDAAWKETVPIGHTIIEAKGRDHCGSKWQPHHAAITETIILIYILLYIHILIRLCFGHACWDRSIASGAVHCGMLET